MPTRASRSLSPKRKPAVPVPRRPRRAAGTNYYFNGSSPRTYTRGWLHVAAAAASPVLGLVLIRHCQSSQAQLAAAIYICGATYLFATSGTFHTVRWQTRAAEDIVRTMDYIGIHVIINSSMVQCACHSLTIRLAAHRRIFAFHLC